MKYNGRNDDERLPLRRVWDRKHNKLGLTQKVAAERLGFNTPSTFAKYLPHEPLNKVSLAVQIARLLEVPVTELISNEVWAGATPEIIFEMAVSSQSKNDLRELEQLVCSYKRDTEILVTWVLP